MSGSAPVRCFLALRLDDTSLAWMRDAQDLIQEALPNESLRALRWSDAAKMHLTLRFLGEVTAEQVEAFSRGLADRLPRHEPVRLDFAMYGAFPSLRKPRVLWLGPEGTNAALLALRKDVDALLEACSVGPEPGRFRPHVTIARVRDRRGASPGTPLASDLRTASEEIELRPHAQVADTVELYRSDLGGGAPRYSLLSSWRIGASAPDS